MKTIAILSSLLCAYAVSAADGFMPWAGVLTLADTDADGLISMDEVKEFRHTGEYAGFQPFMADHFTELDRNSDEMVSGEELERGIMRMGMSDKDVADGFRDGFGFMMKQ